MTPVQLLTVGTLLSDHAISPAESLSSEHDNITVTGTVEVPQTPIPLDPDDNAVVETIVNTLPVSPNGHYIDTYKAVREYVYNHVQ